VDSVFFASFVWNIFSLAQLSNSFTCYSFDKYAKSCPIFLNSRRWYCYVYRHNLFEMNVYRNCKSCNILSISQWTKNDLNKNNDVLFTMWHQWKNLNMTEYTFEFVVWERGVSLACPHLLFLTTNCFWSSFYFTEVAHVCYWLLLQYHHKFSI
jgi:hypothetical protein